MVKLNHMKKPGFNKSYLLLYHDVGILLAFVTLGQAGENQSYFTFMLSLDSENHTFPSMLI